MRGENEVKEKSRRKIDLDFSGKIGYCDVAQQLFFVNIISARIHATSFRLEGKKNNWIFVC